jgi:putative ABC transport system permease protein
MAAISVALVVMILFIVLGFVDGMKRTVSVAATSGNWIILSKGATAEPESVITQPQYDVLRAMPEFAVDAHGVALISPEVIDSLNVAPGHAKTMYVYLRGVKPIAYWVHRRMQLVAGHWPRTNEGEWAVGQKLAAKFPQLGLGQKFHFGRRNWTVVGIFSDGGSARESEVWCDIQDLFADYHGKSNGIANIAHVVLKPGEADALKATLQKDPRLALYASSEAEFYADQNQLSDQLESYGLIVTAILAIGAILGGMNIMYAAVMRRRHEIGVLRAVGFGRTNILVCFIAESAMLGLAGGLLGEAIGMMVASIVGLNSRLMNVGALIFSFHLGAHAVLAGLITGILIGVIGGLLPALRASRMGIYESLRGA